MDKQKIHNTVNEILHVLADRNLTNQEARFVGMSTRLATWGLNPQQGLYQPHELNSDIEDWWQNELILFENFAHVPQGTHVHEWS